MSEFTTRLGFEKPDPGTQTGTWGGTLNENFDLIDEAISGSTTVTLPATGSTGTPNALDISTGETSDGRYAFITFDDGGDLGGTAYVQLTPNTAQKIATIRNGLSGGRDIVLFQGTYAAGRAFTLGNGDTAVVVFSGLGAASSTVESVYQSMYTDGMTMGNLSSLRWRNAADTNTIGFQVDASDDLRFTVNGTLRLLYDSSATQFNFQSTNLLTTGSVTAGSVSASGTVTGSNLSGTNTGDEAAASDTVAGVIELATQTEVNTGTDANRAVTPATLANYTGLGDPSPLTTKGDLYVFTTTNARLAVGTNGQVLTADSTAASGVKWTTISTGGLGSVVEDTSPELGGDLVGNNFNISLTNTGTAKQLRFYEPSGGGTSYVAMQAPALSATYTLTLPTTDGNSGEYLQTNGSGVLTWASPTAETPAILSNGVTPSLNTGITALEIRSLIGAGTGDGTLTSVTIGAGEGLTGGGTDSSNPVSLTVNMGTPSTITSSTTNSTTADSHTHALGSIDAADITAGTLAVARGGTGTTTSTGTGSVVLNGSPTFTGTVTAPAFNATSARDKKFFTGTIDLDQIKNLLLLSPFKYRLNDEPDLPDQIGYYADDVATYAPEVVTFDADDKPSGIDYSRLAVLALMMLADIEERLEGAGL